MRKLAIPAVVAVALGIAAIAYAQQPTPSPMTLQATGKISSSKGATKTKGVPVSASMETKTLTADGSRQESLMSLAGGWGGVVSNGKYFPKCDINKINDAQTDKICPKGSLVGSGTLTAVIGPENDFSGAGTPCNKQAHWYNAGQGKMTVMLVGPGSECAGVGYTPPTPAKWSKSAGVNGGEAIVLSVPGNISHPLPGVLASLTGAQVTFKKLVTKVHGKKIGFLEARKCSGTRTFTATIVGDPSGKKVTATSSMGKC